MEKLFGYPFCYENSDKEIEAVKIDPLENYCLRVSFSNGAVKIYDIKSDLDTPAFSPLKDVALFSAVKVVSGVAHWDYDKKSEYLANDIDISETALYWDSVSEHCASK